MLDAVCMCMYIICMMKPMLISEAPYYQEKINSCDYVYIQPKLNGWRCIINTKTGILYSRSGSIITMPHISADILHGNYPEWLDGELYSHGYTLGQIQGMIKRTDTRIKFYCFDVISDGVFSARYKGVQETDNIKTISTEKIKPSEIKRYYQEYLNMGLEGAIIRLDAPYENRRSENIFKLKPCYD
jgi:DNA ligase 1